jgi:transcription initiation factor IIE alpha subunit
MDDRETNGPLALSQPRARRRDLTTSHLAAGMARRFQSGHAKKILEALEGARPGGLTCEEIAERIGIDYHAVSRRMSELRTAGLATMIGAKHNSSGNAVTIWVIA